MARSQSTDFYHSFKFHVNVVTAGIDGGSSIQGGFTTVTMPEATIEAIEYKEGIYLYKRKQPGDVSFSDITLTQGVAKAGTALYDWLQAVILGKAYRVDLVIKHFHREDVTGLENFTTATALRTIQCFDCFPIRNKPGSDFDASSSEISIAELDLAIEKFYLVDDNTPAA